MQAANLCRHRNAGWDRCPCVDRAFATGHAFLSPVGAKPELPDNHTGQSYRAGRQDEGQHPRLCPATEAGDLVQIRKRVVCLARKTADNDDRPAVPAVCSTRRRSTPYMIPRQDLLSGDIHPHSASCSLLSCRTTFLQCATGTRQQAPRQPAAEVPAQYPRKGKRAKVIQKEPRSFDCGSCFLMVPKGRLELPLPCEN